MRKIKLTLALVATFISFGAFAQTAQEVQTKFNEAATAYNEKKFTVAIPLFKEVISMGEMSEADVTKFVDDAKKFLYTSYINAGKLTARTRDFEAAIKLFQLAEKATINLVEKNGANKMITVCYNAMVNEKIKADDMAGAAEIANKGYEANKRDYKIGVIAARCYAKSGNIAKALTIYDEIIALGKMPRFVNAAEAAKKSASDDMLSIAINFIKEKNYAQALTALESATKYTPNSAAIEMARIQIFNDTKNYAKIAEFGSNAVAIQTTNINKSNAAFMVAIAYQELKNNAKAIEYYKQVVEGPSVEVAAKLVTQLTKKPE